MKAPKVIKRVYNLVRQPQDGRDYSLPMALKSYKEVALPPSYDLSMFCPPIYTQEIGDCTANAGLAAKYMLDHSPPPATALKKDVVGNAIDSTIIDPTASGQI